MVYQWEWAYNVLRDEAVMEWGIHGPNSLRSVIAWWRQVTHFAGGLVLGMPVSLTLLALAERNIWFLTSVMPGFIYALLKENRDISEEGETAKNSLDIFFWSFGSVFLGLIFLVIRTDFF